MMNNPVQHNPPPRPARPGNPESITTGVVGMVDFVIILCVMIAIGVFVVIISGVGGR